MNHIRQLCSHCAVVALLLLATFHAWAQPRVEVAGTGSTRIPIAVAPFAAERETSEQISRIIAADLERSGYFKTIDAALPALDDSTPPNLAPVRAKAADALTVGSVQRLGDGRYRVSFRLWDVVRAQESAAHSYIVGATDLRLAAHRIADAVYHRLTGEPGFFCTRIAYVTRAAGTYHLWVADADGANPAVALSSRAPIISPSWSPDGNRLAYVSFESRKPVVYVHEVATGKRRLIANFRGSNSAPAWSPDGKTLAVTLTREGNSQLYTISAGGGQPHRLTQSAGIDTEPVYAPDGRHIFFVSDRGGSPQIYKVPANGGMPERVTHEGSYNISPAVSPDGRRLSYVSRINGLFRLQLMELATGEVRTLTTTSDDEKPSFAPNGRLIVYATRVAGQETLMTTTLDGKVQMRVAANPGDIREPDWGPFIQ